jgi:hypothetical protein
VAATRPIGTSNAFVAKISPSGSTLAYSTLAGGSAPTEARGVAIDSTGSAYIGGVSDAQNYVAKLSADAGALTPLVFGGYSYLSGAGGVNGVAAGLDGSVYAIGTTAATNFPTTPGSFQPAYGSGASDAFVVKASFADDGSGGGTPDDIVIYANDVSASARHGSWNVAGDPTAAAGVKLITPDNGVANTTAPLASPTDYVDVTFHAPAGTPFAIWMRMQALNNTKFNDSVWVQFSDAQSSGSSKYPIGSASALLVNLATDSNATSLNGWGWQNGAYWLSQTTTVTFAAGGTHIMRIQTREDGVQIDQIVFSPSRYLTAAPGSVSDDHTIVAKPGGGGTSSPPPPPNAPSPSDGATGIPRCCQDLTWSGDGATSWDLSFGINNPPMLAASNLRSPSYRLGALTNDTTYYWQVVAHNSSGATTGPVWSFRTAPAASTGNIVIYASDIPVSARHGSWSAASDATAAGGAKLQTPDAGVSNTSGALAAPTDYVDVTFDATAGTTYTLWLRLQALNNSKYNDSVFVQFSDATAGGAPVYSINTASALLVNLATDSAATSLNGWGWQNGAYWLSQATSVSFSASGLHTMRIQVREDGVQFDQIVLSSSTYANSAPGAVSGDTTIVPR